VKCPYCQIDPARVSVRGNCVNCGAGLPKEDVEKLQSAPMTSLAQFYAAFGPVVMFSKDSFVNQMARMNYAELAYLSKKPEMEPKKKKKKKRAQDRVYQTRQDEEDRVPALDDMGWTKNAWKRIADHEEDEERLLNGHCELEEG
jgi:hypothetical protein